MKWSELCWLDIETTGTDPEHEHAKILEIGMLKTDDQLRIVAERSWVIGTDTHLGWDEWCREQHMASGLWFDCANADNLATVRNSVLRFIDKNWPDKPPRMAGSALSFEEMWLRKHIPLLLAAFNRPGGRHTFDLRTVRSYVAAQRGEYFVNKIKDEFCEPKLHRACADLRANILELRGYLGDFQLAGRCAG